MGTHINDHELYAGGIAPGIGFHVRCDYLLATAELQRLNVVLLLLTLTLEKELILMVAEAD